MNNVNTEIVDFLSKAGRVMPTRLTAARSGLSHMGRVGAAGIAGDKCQHPRPGCHFGLGASTGDLGRADGCVGPRRGDKCTGGGADGCFGLCCGAAKCMGGGADGCFGRRRGDFGRGSTLTAMGTPRRLAGPASLRVRSSRLAAACSKPPAV